MEPQTQTQAHRTNKQRVLHAVSTLCEHNQLASRQSVIRITGLSKTTVDERIKDLKAEGLIRCDVPGFYEPVDHSVDRMVSVTNMPHGRVKVEIGDSLLVLTPREAFELAKFLAGMLFAFATATFKSVR